MDQKEKDQLRKYAGLITEAAVTKGTEFYRMEIPRGPSAKKIAQQLKKAKVPIVRNVPRGDLIDFPSSDLPTVQEILKANPDVSVIGPKKQIFKV